jgi:subtilisin family serine protease
MAAPHVAGIVALMAQKNPALGSGQDPAPGEGTAEQILQDAAIQLPAGCRAIVDPNVGPTTICWGADATGSGLVTADAALAATP